MDKAAGVLQRGILGPGRIARSRRTKLIPLDKTLLAAARLANVPVLEVL
jgi:hypothetical protein